MQQFVQNFISKMHFRIIIAPTFFSEMEILNFTLA